MAKLRTAGVEIRNHGCILNDDTTWRAWANAAEEWSRKVYESLKSISEADAEFFRVLDVVPSEPRVIYVPFNEEHMKVFREHDCRLDRLGRMVYNLWRE